MNNVSQFKKLDYLISVIKSLSLARSLESVIEITRHAARELTGADGATFVLRDGDKCYYVDEDAIEPLWKGLKFPMSTCISGWAMLNKESVAIRDIYQDERIPHDAYRPTFVKSLLMVPIRKEQPIGAIGNYWATAHETTEEEKHLLEILADSTSTALENIQLLNSLKKANESLSSSLKSRDEFLSIASHELRTPVTTIKLQLQITDRKLKQNNINPSVININSALRQTEHLSNLIEQLLDISRIQLNSFNLNYEEINCSEFINEVINKYTTDFEQVGCLVHCNIEENVLGKLDCSRLKHILDNLLSNIIKHAPKSEVFINLKKSKENNFVLEIKDTGPGIDLEVIQRLFNRFERGESSTNIAGLGLGLYIVKTFVEAHGGTISVKSNINQGSCFRIILPLALN